MKKLLVLLSAAVVCAGVFVSCASTKEAEEEVIAIPAESAVSAVSEESVTVEPEEDVGLYK